jgi:GT2 family glycosyltransferase
MKSTVVSVIIPSAGQPAALQSCLESLGRVDGDGMEVVVALDGGSSPVEQLSRRSDWPWPLRWTCLDQRRGPGAARNRGAAEARGRHLIFLDDDMRVENDFVSSHLAPVAQNPNAAIIGAILTRCIGCSGAYRHSFERYWERRHDRLTREPNASFWDCFTGNLSIDAETFRRIGGFDESMLACEDLELGLRLTRAGVPLVYAARAMAIQHHNKGSSDTIRDCERRGKALVRLWRAYPEARGRIVFARSKIRLLQKWVLAFPWRSESLMFILPWLPATRLTDNLFWFLCEIAQNRAARHEFADEPLWAELTS